jgi:carbamoylphosphate synthase small subunit
LQIIRETGAVLGRVNYQNESLSFANPNETNLVASVSTKTIKVFGKGQSPKILMLDCGIKYNIIRYFVNVQKVSHLLRCSRVTSVPCVGKFSICSELSSVHSF